MLCLVTIKHTLSGGLSSGFSTKAQRDIVNWSDPGKADIRKRKLETGYLGFQHFTGKVDTAFDGP